MISGETKIVGLIGNPVKHSFSPPMHNSAFKELELDYVYLAFKVEQDNIEDALNGIKALEIEGVNVTIPHKSAVMKYLNEIDETAKKIGAVNTIKREGEKLKGFNTDGIGVLKSLKNKIGNIENKNVLLLGAGGAARAIAFTLVEAGVNLTISNRTASKAKELAKEIEEKTGSKIRQIPQKRKKLAEAIKSSEILINSTPVGMHPNTDKTLVEAEDMHPDLTVMDIVYNPIKTQLLKEAEKVGARTISGIGMLVNQGAASFKIWTNETAPVEIMKKAALRALEGKEE